MRLKTTGLVLCLVGAVRRASAGRGAGLPRPHQRHRHRQHRRGPARRHGHGVEPGADPAAGAGHRRRRRLPVPGAASGRLRGGLRAHRLPDGEARQASASSSTRRSSVDQQLQVATLQETVTVTGESPVVDTSTTTMGTNFTKELLTEIPNARDVWAAMAQAPGMQMTPVRRRRLAHRQPDRLPHLRLRRPEPDPRSRASTPPRPPAPTPATSTSAASRSSRSAAPAPTPRPSPAARCSASASSRAATGCRATGTATSRTRT